MNELWVHRCMIIPATLAPQIRQLASSFGSSAENMWTTTLAPPGETVATHYISTGLIHQSFADMISSSEALQAGCTNIGVTLPIENCQILLSSCDITEDEPFSAMARMGLKIMETQIEGQL